MDDPDNRIKQSLSAAYDHYKNRDYHLAKKQLDDIKYSHHSIDLNSLICEYKEQGKNAFAVLKNIMDLLTKINIDIYNKRPKNIVNHNSKLRKNWTPQISHEYYFWNIIILSQLLGENEIAYLVGAQALHYSDWMRTQTTLMIIYQMLKAMEGQNRLASCIDLNEKQSVVVNHVKSLTKEEQTYRTMNQILFNKVLLKLGMIEGSKTMYMMKFNQAEEQKDQDSNQIPIKIHQEFLHAQIQYYSKNNNLALKFMSDLIPMTEDLKAKDKQLVRSMIDHNCGVVLANSGKIAAGKYLMNRAYGIMSNIKQTAVRDNQRLSYLQKCKQNLLYASLMQKNVSNAKQVYENMSGSSYSFKVNYRKAETCLNYYHSLLKQPQKYTPWTNIHDFYETTYFYPNMPYFQQKSKNKNVNYTNGKFYHRRYILSQWNQALTPPKQYIYKESQDQNITVQNQTKNINNSKVKEKVKVKKNGKKEDEEKIETNKMIQVKNEASEIQKNKILFKAKLNDILTQVQFYLKQSLIILEREKNVIVNLQGSEKELTHQVNEKLYSQYIEYKGSIYSLLCYTFLCKYQWTKVIYYAKQYKKFQKLFLHDRKNTQQQQFYYNILSYEMEAFCQLNRLQKSYEVMHSIINNVGYSEQIEIETRSTINQSEAETYFETVNQYHNFCYNISVLHSRDNNIPESHQCIQKLLHHMRLSPSNPQANIPMSSVDLLVHYNLRTYNHNSALQMIKRKRILVMQGMVGPGNPTLNITK